MAVEVVWVTEIGRRRCGSDAVLRLSGLQQFKRLNHLGHGTPGRFRRATPIPNSPKLATCSSYETGLGTAWRQPKFMPGRYLIAPTRQPPGPTIILGSNLNNRESARLEGAADPSRLSR